MLGIYNGYMFDDLILFLVHIFVNDKINRFLKDRMSRFFKHSGFNSLVRKIR